VATVLSLALSGAGAASRERRPKLPKLSVIDPVEHDYDDAIVERKLITARDGITSLALDIIRPDTKKPVPTIFFQSPYYNTVGRGFKHETKTPWGTGIGGGPSEPVTPFPEWYDEYFVPRGYAVVMMDQRGTRNSSGCQVYGGREEATDAVDGIEWIADQKWSNDAVGMTGGSYDGTVAIAAASEAPKALKAIIPIRAIDRWYDYHFFNGVQSSEHLLTPFFFTTIAPVTDQQNSAEDDALYGLHVIERKACAVSLGAAIAAQYSTPYQDSTADFWKQRDWLRNAKDITAATFIIHGLADTNVKTTNALHLWDALPKATPKRLWWSQMGHDDPKAAFGPRFVESTHRWFARYLKGIDTGVDHQLPVSVEQRDGSWRSEAQWPPAGGDQVFHLGPNGLSPTPKKGTLEYSNGPGPQGRIELESDPYDRDTRLAGQAYLKLVYSLSQGGDSTFAYRLEEVGPGGSAREISTAYARGAYRDDIKRRGASNPTLPQPHVPGELYDISFPFLPHDYVVQAGSRLRLTIQADDDRILGGGTGGVVTLMLKDSLLVLPSAR
jgi:X-Pro dipeptidyl-peptidase